MEKLERLVQNNINWTFTFLDDNLINHTTSTPTPTKIIASKYNYCCKLIRLPKLTKHVLRHVACSKMHLKLKSLDGQ